MKFRETVFFLGLLLWSANATFAGPLSDTNTVTYAVKDFLFSFPTDHGAHPKYQTEWWYLTGQLFTGQDEPFKTTAKYGFQLTFFRTLRDGKQWHLAHAAITDIPQKQFFTEQRLASDQLRVAETAEHSLSVHHADWQMMQDADGRLKVHFTVYDREKKLSLSLSSVLPDPLLHGENGYSRKGQCETCASEYYSLPRLQLTGEVVEEATHTPVHGLGWFDHEFMSNTLEKGQSGWDWLSVMLADGRNLMVFQLRDSAGNKNFGAWTLQDGQKVTHGSGNDFTLTPTEWWTNPSSGKKYPSAITVQIPAVGITLPVKALVPDQLHPTRPANRSPAYWEGAITGDSYSAVGYLEMTGYEDPLAEDTL